MTPNPATANAAKMLSDESITRLAHLGDEATTAVRTLIAAGMPQRAAVDVVLLRWSQYHSAGIVESDAAVFTATGDADLVLELAHANVSTLGLISGDLVVRDVAEVRCCTRRGLTISELRIWTDTGRTAADLDDLLGELGTIWGAANARIIDAVANGVTPADLRWLSSCVPGSLGYPLSIPDHLTGPDQTPARRLALAIEGHGHSATHATAVATAAHDAPWIDLATALIAGGTDTTDAIVTAQAEHALHEQQARRVPRTPSTDRARTP